jgi:hypothetical protein
MYLRITRSRMDPAQADQGTRLAQDILTAAQQLPGLRGFYGGSDRASGQGIVVTLWDTREQAQFSRDALGDVVHRLRERGVQMEAPEIYEVVTQL